MKGRRLYPRFHRPFLIAEYAYDKNGRIMATTAPDGALTQYTYDENGNRVSQTDPLGQVVT